MPKGKAVAIVLAPYMRLLLEKQLEQLEQYVDDRAAFHAQYKKTGKTPQYEEADVFPLLRLKAILLAADGQSNRQIADELEVSQHTIGKWRNNFSYILSRKDLPPQAIAEFFLYTEKPVAGILNLFLPKK